MNISILVFGSDYFITTLPDRIRDATAFSLVVAANLNQALSYLQMTPPDVLIVQASCHGSMELCRWLKEQAKLAWVYCILLEDRPHMHSQKSLHGWEWEFTIASEALQQGADAYLWHLVGKANGLENAGSHHDDHQLWAQQQLLWAQLMVGLRKAHKYRDLMHKNDCLSAIALSDPLTELNNRRALEWELPRQIQKSRSFSTPLSLIILDVDYFKSVNDTYGHLIGDKVLQLLCARLRHNLRFQDTPFRYGGEEFVIIMGNTSCEEALLVAHRLNRLVGEQPFAIDSHLDINVTISLGSACLQPDDDSSGISLLHRADQYLLHAKATGRNKAIGCTDFLSTVPELEPVSSGSGE